MKKHDSTAYVDSVANVNGMILYGLDDNDKPHDKKMLLIKKDGSLLSRGQAVVFKDDDGRIVSIKKFSNKKLAWDYLFLNVVSRGIIA